MKNLDRDPMFWLLVLSLTPFMLAVEIVVRVGECQKRWRKP